jgi:hypothetical protein
MTIRPYTMKKEWALMNEGLSGRIKVMISIIGDGILRHLKTPQSINFRRSDKIYVRH